MTSVREEHRHALLDEAAAGLAASDLVGAEFFAYYYSHVDSDDLMQRQPEDLRGIVLSHWALAEQRRPGESLVRCFAPTIETHGWATGNTVVQVVTDNRAFTVDSILAAVGRQGLEVRLLVHPQPVVARDAEGRVTGLDDTGFAESWVHLEVERLPDEAAEARLVERLEKVLGDVDAAVSDWGR